MTDDRLCQKVINFITDLFLFICIYCNFSELEMRCRASLLHYYSQWLLDLAFSSSIIFQSFTNTLVIRLEARLQPNIGNTLERALTVFTRSDITPPWMNRYGWNLEHSEYIVWGWPWKTLSAIRTVARAGEWGKFCFFCQVSNAQLHRFPVGQIFTKLNTTRRSMSRLILLEQNFENFPIRGHLSQNAKFSQKFSTSSDFRRAVGTGHVQRYGRLTAFKYI